MKSEALSDEKSVTTPKDRKAAKPPAVAAQPAKKEEEGEGEKGNASEKINLQHIMELREAFEAADTDKGGALEIEEFIEAFGGVIGKGMNQKQLN